MTKNGTSKRLQDILGAHKAVREFPRSVRGWASNNEYVDAALQRGFLEKISHEGLENLNTTIQTIIAQTAEAKLQYDIANKKYITWRDRVGNPLQVFNPRSYSPKWRRQETYLGHQLERELKSAADHFTDLEKWGKFCQERVRSASRYGNGWVLPTPKAYNNLPENWFDRKDLTPVQSGYYLVAAMLCQGNKHLFKAVYDWTEAWSSGDDHPKEMIVRIIAGSENAYWAADSMTDTGLDTLPEDDSMMKVAAAIALRTTEVYDGAEDKLEEAVKSAADVADDDGDTLHALHTIARLIPGADISVQSSSMMRAMRFSDNEVARASYCVLNNLSMSLRNHCHFNFASAYEFGKLLFETHFEKALGKEHQRGEDEAKALQYASQLYQIAAVLAQPQIVGYSQIKVTKDGTTTK